MKKIILILGLLMIAMLIYNNKEEYILIPNEAIRVRVIANSDNIDDIDIKEKVKDDLSKELIKLLENVNTINEVRKIINNNLDFINRIVDKSLKMFNYDKSYTINYGLNYFPEKEFKEVKYDSGYYESLVITLGEGKGPNYWCVLYPPLCNLNEVENKEIEYKILIKELIDKYL